MTEAPSIQWFPGHMAKTRRLMRESLRLVDVVVEVIDARIPISSRNPELPGLVGQKPRIVLLNKCDAADEMITRDWCNYYKEQGIAAIPTDCRSGKGIKQFVPTVKEVLRPLLERRAQKGMQGAPIRMMIVGIPNVGKSTFINSFAGKACAKTGNKPGVTKGKQWIRLNKGLELLDTPGILWPKFEDQAVGERLALIGSMNDEILNREEMALSLLVFIGENYPEALEKRYQLTLDTAGADGDAQASLHSAIALLEAVCKSRGCLKKGGEPEYEKGAALVLDDFRSGRLGRMTLELPKKEA